MTQTDAKRATNDLDRALRERDIASFELDRAIDYRDAVAGCGAGAEDDADDAIDDARAHLAEAEREVERRRAAWLEACRLYRPAGFLDATTTLVEVDR